MQKRGQTLTLNTLQRLPLVRGLPSVEAQVSFLEASPGAGFEIGFEMASGAFIRKRGIPVKIPRLESIGMSRAAFVMRLQTGSKVFSQADVESIWLDYRTQNIDVMHLCINIESPTLSKLCVEAPAAKMQCRG